MNLYLPTHAFRRWLLLRSHLHDVVEKEKSAELRVTRLTHGLEPGRVLEAAAELRAVVQDVEDGRFVLLDGAGFLHLYRDNGFMERKLQAPLALAGLLRVQSQMDTVARFVGWGPLGLALLRPDFSLLWLSEPRVRQRLQHKPVSCLLVPTLEQLLVADSGGGLSLWKFHAGGNLLLRCGSPLQPQPCPKGSFTRLVLGPETAQGPSCCFAVYGSEVFTLTMDLHTWSLTDMRRNLHKTTIMDLVYCRELTATITASQDSTVKVWELNWQVRMVFLGHTGPVTALALLPDTSLLVSASRDGTLRTWDLQEAMQVGEVALDSLGPAQPLGPVTGLLPPTGPGCPLLCLRTLSLQLWRLRTLYLPLAQLSAPVLQLQVAPPLPGPMQPPMQPPLPERLVCACADGSVYLVSVATGLTVCVLLLPPEDSAAAVAYCLPLEVLCLLTGAGHLVFATAACCPMRVLHRKLPPPPPSSRPCCLHLYSHVSDPKSAFDSWKMVREHGAQVPPSDTAGTWKDKNRYLPLVGHTDGKLEVLELLSWKTTFYTDAHCPSPVIAIASTWNSIVTSGGDLMVKVWRVFPYAEESLSLLCTFRSYHPAVALCILGRTIAVGFENLDSATYGLVHFSLDHDPRQDHPPQDDPTDHITGLCCCPLLKLYASSSLDCTVRIWTAENRLLRILQLDGVPQALAFCGNIGDLALALGSRLCLVPHSLYLPTSYLLKKLCQTPPDVVDDPPLPLTHRASLTADQLQRLHSSCGVYSILASRASKLDLKKHLPSASRTLQQDLEVLINRDNDLKKLKLGLVVRTHQPLLSWRQQQEAFENYLSLIYGPASPTARQHLLRRLFQDLSTSQASQHRSFWESEASPSPMFLQAADHQTLEPTTALEILDLLPTRQLPPVSFPITPIPPEVHSKASQLLASSSLSSSLSLSLDLQLQESKRLLEGRPKIGPPLDALRNQIPLQPKTETKELVPKTRGFFPATLGSSMSVPPPIQFPGCVPNSVVLQQMWLSTELPRLPTLWKMPFHLQRQIRTWGRLWPSLKRWLWRRKLVLYGDEEEEEEEEKRMSSDFGSEDGRQSLLQGGKELQALGQLLQDQNPSDSPLDSAQSQQHSQGKTLWLERYGHLPHFLLYFVVQNWFKNLFPLFTLEAYPEMGTVEGLASQFVELLRDTSWADRVHLLRALLRLLPSTSQQLRDRLYDLLVLILNQEKPPSLQDETQKKFVMLAMQLLLACSLESSEVVVELLSYFLYSPSSCWPEIQSLLVRMGLCDPHGFLYKEMLTWVQGLDGRSKAILHMRCQEKLEELIQKMEMADTVQEVVSTPTAQTSAPLPRPKDSLPQILSSSKAPSRLPLRPAGVAVPKEIEGQTWEVVRPLSPPVEACRIRHTLCVLSDVLMQFSPDDPPTSSLEDYGSLLPEHSDWSRMQVLDLKAMDALNYFCEQLGTMLTTWQPQRLQRRTLDQHLWPSQHAGSPKVVLPQLKKTRRFYPIFRLMEAEVQKTEKRSYEWESLLQLQEARFHRSSRLSGEWRAFLRLQEAQVCRASRRLHGPLEHRPLRALKLPLPRVELQPFPPNWPRPHRPLPPLLLQPALQRYFVPENTNPNRHT